MQPEGHAPDGGNPAALTSLHVRRAIAGDRESIGWIVQRLSPLLLAQARYRLGGLVRYYDPEDVVQDAWAVTLPRLADLEERDGRLTPVLLRFLGKTIVHRVLNLFQKQARREIQGEDVDLLMLQEERSGVITQTLRAERTNKVHGAIDQLEEIDRQILILRGIEQVSAATAAVLLGTTVDAVNKRYQRALQRLRENLPGSVFDEVD